MIDMALLIDGDNASPSYLEQIFEMTRHYGRVSMRRIYGDWTKPSMEGWKACLLAHGLQPIQQFACTTGKNATDIAMVIDAMDLLNTQRYNGFCLVSSDSDFTPLAVRLRQQGAQVLGFGERKTPSSFQMACTAFTILNLPARSVLAPKPQALRSQAPNAVMKSSKTDLEPLLRQAFSQTSAPNGWVALGELGHKLREVEKTFRPGDYGATELNKLLKQITCVELNGDAQNMRVRLK